MEDPQLRMSVEVMFGFAAELDRAPSISDLRCSGWL